MTSCIRDDAPIAHSLAFSHRPPLFAVLALAPGDQDAMAAKLYVLIETSRTKVALELLAQTGASGGFPFEYAYCLYKEGRVEDALRQLENIPMHREMDKKRLEAQLYYRLERYEDCIRVYTELFRAPFHEDSIEAKANLVAAYVATGKSCEISAALADVGIDPEESLEVSFNVACGLIANGRLQDAREQLIKTQRIGEETLFDEGLEDDEVAEELAGVDAQMAYVDAVGRDGDLAAAVAGNDRVIGLEGPDDMANVVAAANGVLLQVAQDPRDRKPAQERLKRLEPFLERSGGLLKIKSPLEDRLGKRACIGVLSAYACGSLVANKADHAREAVRSLETMYPGDAVGSLLVAAISAKEGKTKDALACLDKVSLSQEGVGLAAVSLRAQLKAQAKSYIEAADALGDARLSPDVAALPSVVATRSALYELGGDLTKAEQAVLSALSAGGATNAWAHKKLAKIKLASGDLAAATEYLLQLTRVDATAWEDSEVLKLLPRCIACSDPSKHADVGGHDPFSGAAEVDVDALEAQAGSMLAAKENWRDVGERGEGGDADAAGRQEQGEVKSKKRRKKRKIMYPKGFDPEHPERTPQPDPERWLPKWQRSGNKKLRKKMAKNATGSQGAGKIDTSLDYSNKPVAPAKQGKKKKKGGRR